MAGEQHRLTRHLWMGSCAAASALLLASGAAQGQQRALVSPVDGDAGAASAFDVAPDPGVKAKAEAGDVRAMVALAQVYAGHEIDEENEGQEPSDPVFKLAVRWFQKAADLGDAEAMYGLATCYSEGHGVMADAGQAISYFKMAAERGNSNAMYNLAYTFDSGRGVPKDQAEAVRWYKMAADKGDAEAIFALGSKYVEGQGVPRNLSEGFRLEKEAADKGMMLAMLAVARDYDAGQGIAQDKAEAVRWYRSAALAGSAEARQTLKDRGISGQVSR